MELLILSTLDWRMQAATPCSFIETFLSKIKDNQHPFESSISRANQLILSTIKGLSFLSLLDIYIKAVHIFVIMLTKVVGGNQMQVLTSWNSGLLKFVQLWQYWFL